MDRRNPKGKCVNVLKTSRDFDNWQIYVKATRVQCGRGVLRGAGDDRTICFSPDAGRWRTRTTRYISGHFHIIK